MAFQYSFMIRQVCALLRQFVHQIYNLLLGNKLHQ